MLNGFFEFISGALNFFYELVPNYAVAIALLTLCVMVITTPLTLKGTRSMIEMQRLQPQMRKIQLQYKDDPQKRNEALMAFYKEHEINPLGGCFPLLIQAPVFSLLYYVVQGLTASYKFTGVQVKLNEIGIDATVYDGFSPKYLSHDSALYLSLRGEDEMTAFGVDLARSASEALSDSFAAAIPYLLLVAVIAGLSWFQQKQIMGRNPNAEVPPQQKMMMRIGPVMYVFFAFVSPAAIGIYFLVSTLWRVGQQYYITRSLYGHDDAPGAQAQKAMAAMREERKNEGGESGGGLFGGLLGGSGGSGASGKGGSAGRGSSGGGRSTGGKGGTGKGGTSSAKGRAATEKIPTSRSRGGAKIQDAAPAGKGAAATNGKGTQAGTGTTAKPHPRSRKKKKRK